MKGLRSPRSPRTAANRTTHLTAQGNTIGDEEYDGVGGVATTAGIYLQAGSLSTDVLSMCANVGGAGGLANTLANSLRSSGLTGVTCVHAPGAYVPLGGPLCCSPSTPLVHQCTGIQAGPPACA